MTITDLLKNNRPNLSDSSLKTYTSILTSLYKKITKSKDVPPVSFFLKEHSDILDYLKQFTPRRRRNILSALVSLADDGEHKKAVDVYRKQMLKDQEDYEDEQREQKKTNKESENWMSLEDIRKIYQEKEKDTKNIFSKVRYTMDDLQEAQDYIILALYNEIPPRRLKDYTDMKVDNIDKNKDNYFDKKKNKLIFNSYKTSKFYGQQEVDAPPKLAKLLKKWEKMNPSDYLLFDYKGNKLTSDKLTRRLNKIFDRKISVNMLRHIFISEGVLKDVPDLKELEKVAEQMGHNVEQQMLYKKK